MSMISFIRIPCPICQNNQSERLFTDVNRREGLSISATLVECEKCGMRYLNPAPNAASLAQLYWPEGSGEGRTTLDFGCFDGSKLVYWYQRGWRVAGIDLNQQALQVAKEKFTWPVFAERFEQLS